MAELKCPHCGQAFTVDDTELSSIISQIRDNEFKKDLDSRISELEEHMLQKHELELEAQENEIRLSVKEDQEKELQKLRDELKASEDRKSELQHLLDAAEDKKKIAVMEAVNKVEAEKRDIENELSNEKEKGKILLKEKDEQI
ncbi:MAG: hypothetical protein K5870_08720, partial [Lachnospiraceae bacterium]|nr:hypothetical protein [Lachnospiraceae bacterium]